MRHEHFFRGRARGLFIRRTITDLADVIETARMLFAPLEARWREQQKEFRFPSGAVLRMRYLDRDADAAHYQGHSYTRVYVEELTQFPDPAPVDKLKATVRSAAGVPGGFRATCNPGGVGHGWVRARYIDPGPMNLVKRRFVNPFTRATDVLTQMFIPAKLSDNPKLLESDPGYVGRLSMAGSEQLVRAWLLGDWDIVEGAFFSRWRVERNVAKPFAVPEHWLRFRSFDWGYATPFSVGWNAVASDDTPFESITGRRLVLPRGGIVRYREWYGAKTGEPNKGLSRTAEQVAGGWIEEDGSRTPGIVQRDGDDRITYSVADPAIFRRDRGPSIAQTMHKHGVSFRRADNTRVARKGSMGGWNEMRQRIDGIDDDHPMLIVFETCRDIIRTLPVLQHDASNAEDLDTDGEDHAADDCRYACMSRPWARVSPDPGGGRALSVGEGNTVTYNDLIAQMRRGGGDERI
jgi:hypothetical protein